MSLSDDIQSGVFWIPFQYADILAIPLVEKCEVGGQRIFVRISFHITVRRDTKKAIADIKKRRGSCTGHPSS